MSSTNSIWKVKARLCWSDWEDKKIWFHSLKTIIFVICWIRTFGRWNDRLDKRTRHWPRYKISQLHRYRLPDYCTKVNNWVKNKAHLDTPPIADESCKQGTVRYSDKKCKQTAQKTNTIMHTMKLDGFCKEHISGEDAPQMSFEDFKELHNQGIFDCTAHEDKVNPQRFTLNFGSSCLLQFCVVAENTRQQP